MHIIRQPIRSVKDISDVRAWFEFAVDSQGVTPTRANCGGQELGVGAKVLINKGIVAAWRINDATHKELATLDPLHNEHWVYGIGLDGDYFFRNSLDLPPVIMAHLGFYNPQTDILELLEFYE